MGLRLRSVSPHRATLNAALVSCLPLAGRVLEIGNGSRRRGVETHATYTLDMDAHRSPSLVADAHALPFPAARFDGVIACEMLQYVESPVTVLRECFRVLRVGGTLLLSVPYLWDGDGWWRWTAKGIGRTLERAGFWLYEIQPIMVKKRASGWVVVARA